MRETPGEKKYIDLNPTLALEYLTFKKEYEGEDFLYIWNDIIEKWFNAAALCREINDLRRYVRNKDMSTFKGRRDLDNKFNESLWLKIKDNERFNKEEFRSLVGTLMHAINKINKLTDNGKKEIADVFAEASKKKEMKEEKKQERKYKKDEERNKAREREEDKTNDEWMVNKELFSIFSDLQNTYINSKEVGYTMNKEEKESILLEAWTIFKTKNPGIPKEKLDTMYNKIYDNYIY